MAADLEPGYDARFINKVSVQYNGKSIMSGDINFSLSDNPIFKFYFAPQGGGVLSVRAEDTHDSVFTHSVDIEGGE